MPTRYHRGDAFEIWQDTAAWFWRVITASGGGAIGAAASEAEAMHEARNSIEGLLWREGEGRRCPVKRSSESAPVTLAAAGWCRRLRQLEHYVIRAEAAHQEDNFAQVPRHPG